MKRMIDNKKLREIEASGGTQWYTHKLTKNDGSAIFFAFPFEENLIEIGNKTHFGRVFGVLIDKSGPSIGNLNVNATFPVVYLAIGNGAKQIQCYSVVSGGSVEQTTIDITKYARDDVSKYQVF